MPSFAERYRAGDLEAVTAELSALGALTDADFRADAVAVADQVMTTANRNLEQIERRLQGLGYCFAAANSGVRRPPGPELVAGLTAIAATASIPITLDRWFRIVGEVDLSGDHPRLSSLASAHGWISRLRSAADPIVSDPLVLAWFGGLLEESLALTPPEMVLELAPDACQKAGLSGSGPSFVRLGNATFDVTLHGEDVLDGLELIPYLRLAFAWGGFPGLSQEPELAEAARTDLSVLTRDLEPV
jgi:hypothetical protein